MQLYKAVLIIGLLVNTFFTGASVSNAATYYLHKEISQGSIRSLETDAVHGDLLTLSVDGNIVADNIIGNWETTPLGLSSLPSGTYTFNVWAEKDLLSTTAFMYAKLYVNDTSGTLIGTTDSVEITGTDPTEVNFTLTTGSSTSVAITDRVFVELHIDVSAASTLESQVHAHFDTDSSNSRVDAPFSGALALSSPGSASLTASTLASSTQQSTGSLDTITVVDGRESDVGWTVTASATDFTCCSPTRTIPVTNLNINPSNATLTAVSGSLSGVSVGSSHTFTSTTDQTTVVSATSGNGRGHYTIDPDFILTVPVGSYAGSYIATITQTIS